MQQTVSLDSCQLIAHVGCACRFVSEFLAYEPLENPLHPPDHLPSPLSILNWQAGDSFDSAVVLASLLLGAGFNAFMVLGYAPLAVTVNDQTKTMCPILQAEAAAAAAGVAGQAAVAVAGEKKAGQQQQQQGQAEDGGGPVVRKKTTDGGSASTAPSSTGEANFQDPWLNPSCGNCFLGSAPRGVPRIPHPASRALSLWFFKQT